MERHVGHKVGIPIRRRGGREARAAAGSGHACRLGDVGGRGARVQREGIRDRRHGRS